jgi:hypothetical protein
MWNSTLREKMYEQLPLKPRAVRFVLMPVRLIGFVYESGAARSRSHSAWTDANVRERRAEVAACFELRSRNFILSLRGE